MNVDGSAGTVDRVAPGGQQPLAQGAEPSRRRFPPPQKARAREHKKRLRDRGLVSSLHVGEHKRRRAAPALTLRAVAAARGKVPCE